VKRITLSMRVPNEKAPLAIKEVKKLANKHSDNYSIIVTDHKNRGKKVEPV
jgi:ribosomal protein L31E